MALNDLTPEFRESQRRINLGERERVAKAAHLEVAEALRGDAALNERGLNPVLIGSYARDTSIWPGRDVDVFGRLERCDIGSIEPAIAYGLFRHALAVFGDRVEEQPRSLKVNFGPGFGYPARRFLEAVEVDSATIQRIDRLDFGFSVDVVPAVHWDDRRNWAIPTRNLELWSAAPPRERWVKTNPEVLTELTTERNAAIRISGDGAYVPTVKALRQIKAHHLQRTKPSSLYYELILYEGFLSGAITGTSWADLTHSSLRFVVDRLRTAQSRPVQDPALAEPYHPAPSSAELSNAAATLETCAQQASEALMADRCRAAVLWRLVFGMNGHEGHDSVFPVPEGCRADGTALVAIVSNPLRGGNSERGFGKV